jgi:hypothetical protein
MIKRALVLLTMVGVYLWIKRGLEQKTAPPEHHDHVADAEWANEGGQNAPASV